MKVVSLSLSFCHGQVEDHWQIRVSRIRLHTNSKFYDQHHQQSSSVHQQSSSVQVFRSLLYSQGIWLIDAAAAAAKSLQSCPTLCAPIDGSPPGSPVPGILQARTLEWVAISFSNACKWKVKVKSLSRFWLLATPRTAAHQAPPSMGFSRQEYWSGVPSPSPWLIDTCIQSCREKWVCFPSILLQSWRDPRDELEQKIFLWHRSVRCLKSLPSYFISITVPFVR